MLLTIRSIGRLSMIAFVGMLGACTANDHSIYRLRGIPQSPSHLVTVDAKQREIVYGANAQIVADPLHQDKTLTVQGRPYVCAAPPPDVFSVTAQSLSADGSFGQGAGASPTLNVGLKAAFSSSEFAATIARTQTVNMLNYQMYQTCLRGMNSPGGADLELPIQAMRDQRSMVALLAIEQLTGIVRAPSVGIGVGVNASATDSTLAMMQMVKDAQAKVDAAQSNLTDAQSAPDMAGVTDCAKADLTDKQKKACAAVDQATTALASAKTYLKTQTALAAQGPGGAIAGSTPTTPSGIGLPTPSGSEQHPSDAVAVAAAVQGIVNGVYAQDETQLFCIRILGAKATDGTQVGNIVANSSNTGLARTCLDYLMAKTKHDTEMIHGVSNAEVYQEINSLNTTQNGSFQKFVIRSGANFGEPRFFDYVKTRFAEILKNRNNALFRDVNRLLDAKEFAEAEQAYASLYDSIPSLQQEY